MRNSLRSFALGRVAMLGKRKRSNPKGSVIVSEGGRMGRGMGPAEMPEASTQVRTTIAGRAVTVFARTCDYCGAGFESRDEGARFHTDKCRAAWHRTHDPKGTIKGVRKLANGGVSVTIHFAEAEAKRALRFEPKSEAFVGEV